MRSKVFFSLVILGLIFVVSGCSKKQVKEEGGGTSGIDKSKVGVVDIGYSGDMKVVYFEFDTYSLTPETQEVLRENAEWLKKKKNIKVQIEGHCDNRGSEEYNVALGQKRAQAIQNYLKDLGISKNRLTTISYGEEKPIDTGENEDAWAKNRRAEFIITET